jgi:Fic family protein
MDLDALRRSPVGKLVPITGTDPRSGQPWSYWAFVPKPLEAMPTIGLPALNTATKAAMEVARLDQAVSQLPNPEVLLRPIIRREAVSTSALEGTYVAFSDVLEADFMEERHLSSEQREVRNYVTATEQAMELLASYPISKPLVGQLQSIIVRRTPGDTYDAGDLRKKQVCIGAKNRPIEEARFVPPPPGQALERGFSDWERWVNSDNDVPIIAKMALAHYQFETLHPFSDGNGRLGRLAAILQLVQEGILRLPILNLAPQLEVMRDEYQAGLLNVSKTGRYDDWILFFSEAVKFQASRGTSKINRMLVLRDKMVDELRAAGIRGSALQIAENLIGYPVIDVPTARAIVGKSFEAANQAVARLVENEILREITGKPQDRLFVCNQVLTLIED